MNKLYKTPKELESICCKKCKCRLDNVLDNCGIRMRVEIHYIVRNAKNEGWKCLQYKKI